MSNKPTDNILYEKVKKNVYKDIPKHSAYRSGIVVQKYKNKFTEKYGKNKKPYTGKKTQKKGLKRWKALAGPRGRFMRFLVTQIINKKAKWDDETVSPKIRQVLQHWGYKLTKKDYENEVKRRKNK